VPGQDEETTATLKSLSTQITEGVATTNQAAIRLLGNVASLESRQTITAQEWEAVSNERSQVREKYNSTVLPLIRQFNTLFDSAPKDINQTFAATAKRLGAETRELVTNAVALNTRIKELAKKIEDGGGE